MKLVEIIQRERVLKLGSMPLSQSEYDAIRVHLYDFFVANDDKRARFNILLDKKCENIHTADNLKGGVMLVVNKRYFHDLVLKLSYDGFELSYLTDILGQQLLVSIP